MNEEAGRENQAFEEIKEDEAEVINLTEDSQIEQSPALLRGAGPSVYREAAIHHSPM